MRTEQIPLLKADPDLGALLAEPRRSDAERRLLVSTHRLGVGPWDVSRLSGASADHIGLLVLEGVIARELIVADHVSAELLGPGDLIRPVAGRLEERAAARRRRVERALARRPSPCSTAASPPRSRSTPRSPPRCSTGSRERSLRLATTQAISQLTRVDRRLKALFWHLAERWGRVGGEGVVIPLALDPPDPRPARGRPPADRLDGAVSELAERDELVRRADGSWLLRGDPPDASTLERGAARHARVGDLLRPARRFTRGGAPSARAEPAACARPRVGCGARVRLEHPRPRRRRRHGSPQRLRGHPVRRQRRASARSSSSCSRRPTGWRSRR